MQANNRVFAFWDTLPVKHLIVVVRLSSDNIQLYVIPRKNCLCFDVGIWWKAPL